MLGLASLGLGKGENILVGGRAQKGSLFSVSKQTLKEFLKFLAKYYKF